MEALEVKNLIMRFGGLTAVDNVDLTIEPGIIHSIIGPNGAGKTTVFNVISGVYQPTQGSVALGGMDLRKEIRPWDILLFTVIGFICALLFIVVLNIQSLWQAVIIDNFVYRQSFPWAKSLGDLFRFLSEHIQSDFLWFLVAFITAAAGAYQIWSGGRAGPQVVAARGISRTFQNIRLFSEMTVIENILVGMETKLSCRFWHAACRLPLVKRESLLANDKAEEILELIGLSQEKSSLASSLSYGDQRRLEIGRALAAAPKVILLDEPAAGMNPSESTDLLELIKRIRDTGVTVLLIEHHMKVVMSISDRISVLDYGEKIAEGTPQEIRSNPKVIEAYLGKDGEH